jgi:hypothetical protein
VVSEHQPKRVRSTATPNDVGTVVGNPIDQESARAKGDITFVVYRYEHG